MSIAKSRGITSLIATLLGVLLVPELAQGATYSVRVRWTASAGPNVTGYRVTARPRTEASPLVVDAGLPAAGTDGSLAAVVSGLDGRTDYDVTVTAYASSGAESLPSNAIAVGYGQVAGRIDTDGDGLTDAVEDRNLNRMVDAGETSALSADTDGDNVGDATDQCQGMATGTPVNAPGCSCAEVTCGGGGGENTIWPSTTVPIRADGGPDSPAELGVKFRADVAGFITGVRFYKHALNTGAHVGNLWSSTGTLLATATFTAETASGWQQVTFSPPVAIAANTVYVASYYCPNGHYSEDLNYFATQGVDRPPLHAPANGVEGPNSVYAYGSPSSFPTQTWHAANYWVDVVFSPTAPASLSAAATLSDTTTPGVAQRAGRIDPDGDRTGGTESEDSCPSPADEPSTSRRDSGVRRVTLDRSGTDYRLTAIGRFAIPDGLDLGTSGMTLVFEDGVHRRLLAVNLSGGDFEPTRTGWKARAGASTFERVAVRRTHGRVVVSLRGGLPLFALVDAAGAIAGPTDPALHWRVRFGAVCSDSLQLVCSENAAGRRRCRGRAGAAGGSSRSARERR
jgi:Domain of unknown function (DUF4082)/Fibronectin type III domain